MILPEEILRLPFQMENLEQNPTESDRVSLIGLAAETPHEATFAHAAAETQLLCPNLGRWEGEHIRNTNHVGVNQTTAELWIFTQFLLIDW